MKTTWVVVADEAIARVLQWPAAGDELESVEELTDPEAHAAGAEFRYDAHGRRAGGAGQRGPSSVTTSSGVDVQHLEAEEFARRVAQRLEEAQQQHRYDELRIVAAPRFLGLLRKSLSGNVAKSVTEEIDKDLVKASNRELTERLFH
jgi:protein required for attachment to host cells